MRLPKNLLSPGVYVKPRIFLCETDKTRICQLDTTDTRATLKFNSHSELAFEVARICNNITTGETIVNPYFDKIEAVRLIEVEGFGYFELQGPKLTSDGIKEAKECTAYSLEYTLSQKYLEDFNVNTGGIDDMAYIYAVEKFKDKADSNYVPISLYNPGTTGLSLLNLILEKIYGWRIGHVDAQLKTLTRQFEIDRTSVYDFLMNDICEKFNCYIVFNTYDNTINVYAESPTVWFDGNGTQKQFVMDNMVFGDIETVAIDGYKTTGWEYAIASGDDGKLAGVLTLDEAPASGTKIEVVGIDSAWETDVFIAFDNLAQEINVDYSADDIKTVLTVTYGDDDFGISEVNLGLPYLTDISYFYTVDWMGQDLYDAYTAYMKKSNELQADYANNSKEIEKIRDQIAYEESRLSMEYSLVTGITSETYGTYYVKQTDSKGIDYYTEVSLPGEHVTNTDYYSNISTNVNETKVSNLYSVLQRYYCGLYNGDAATRNKALTELNELSDTFKFMKEYTIAGLHDILETSQNAGGYNVYDKGICNFLKEMWAEVGRSPLKEAYLKTYEDDKDTYVQSGASVKSSKEYGKYYVVMLFIDVLNTIIVERDKIIGDYKDAQKEFSEKNANINKSLSMDKNFTEGQLIRLNAFLREDELHIDDIVETSIDDISSSFKIKRNAMESGRIELKKLCQPQLQFSMNMANIYALPEFEPIIDQFQLGNMIKVALRPDYIKQSRLMQVDINFDDFSDFSCEFGELKSLRSQSDIHADLLKNVISAGKSVATNSSYWTHGTNVATSTDLKIQQGLLDAVTQIKAIDGTQGVVIDKYGIKLQLKDPITGEIAPRQGWIVNNQFLYSDDGFKSAKAAFGEYQIDSQTYWGLLAEAVIAGYIEGSKIYGSTINGGTINIGDGAFMVDPDGTVTMNGANTIDGYAKTDQLNGIEGRTPVVSNSQPSNPTDGQLWLDTSTSPYTLKVYNANQWVYFDQQNGGKIYTTIDQPNLESCSIGDIWVLGPGAVFEKDGVQYESGSMLIVTLNDKDQKEWVDANSAYTTMKQNIEQHFTFDKTNGLKIGQTDQKFYVNIKSIGMEICENPNIESSSSGVEHDPNSVVLISNESAEIKNATFKGDNGTTFNNNTQFNQPVDMMGFVWQKEQNGSLSLAIGQQNISTEGG